MDDIEEKQGLENIKKLGLVSFFTDFSSEMVFGILPYFIVSTLGLSRAFLGVLDGSSELSSYAFRMLSGTLSDKVGKRKTLVLCGYGLSTVSKPFFSLSGSWFDTFLIRNSDRIGKGIRTAPRDALISESVSASKQGRAFGLHRTLDQMGAIVGPLVAFVLLQVIDLRSIFLVSLIPGIVAVLILIFFVKEKPKVKTSATRIFSLFGSALKGNKQFVFFLSVSAIFSAGAFNFSFVLLRSSDLGVDKNFIPLIYLAINVAHTAIGFPIGVLSDKIRKELVILLSYAIFGISLFLMSIGHGVIFAYLIAAVFGLYVGISETVSRAIVPRFVGPELRGTAFGIYNLSSGVAFFASNVIFGFLWDSFGLNTGLMYSSIMTGIASIGLVLFMKKFKV
ncbi:MAG TPA: MFS transporter [Candidatus Nitrosotenuis sp.]|jgi:MFS family permease|nr:MFS transporter [Candidatus Nitrosotenuis sp.]HIH46397.1 MFS transporter [Candidatus Nitrosotenuis sp.]HIH68664.1 MFS transporter [Candidatus Nitrosotenuis sp.]